MPNEVNNYLSFQGDEAEIKNVLEFLNNEHDDIISFEKIVPPPQDDDSFNSDWRMKNWGTSKIAFFAELSDNEITFITAWSPPDKIIIALAKLYPNIEFDMKYIEYETGFCGRIACKGDNVIIDIHYDSFNKRAKKFMKEVGLT